jgi:hypothetical protein
MLSVFLITSSQGLSQKNTLLHVGVSEGLYLYRTSNKDMSTFFLKSNLEIGAQFELENSRLSTFGIYQLFGNLKSKELNGFILSSHLLGIGAEHRVNKDKEFSLIIGLSALTEFNTNFRNGYVNNGVPVYSSKEHSDDFYHSTPFSSSFWIGLDIQLIEGLNLSFSIENNFRIIKKRHLDWDMTSFDERPIEDIINEQVIETVIYDKIGLRLDLNYNFSFKKERKN